MRFGSVCSGIEAASVAWEPLGWSAAWFAEIEDFPSAVLKHHWPHVVNWGDMTRIAGLVKAGLAEAPEILVGGTPCQAFSVAGLRKSLDDDRGQLSLEYVKLLNQIDETRKENGQQPAICVWENVPGVLNTKDNAFGCFLAALAGEEDPLQPPRQRWTNAGVVHGPQRVVAWRVVDAQYFGVAQRRRRVFVVASARADFDPSKVLFEREGMQRHTPPSREAGEDAPRNVGEGTKTKSLSHWIDPEAPHRALQARDFKGVGNQDLADGGGLVASIHDKATRHRGGGETRDGDGSGNGLGVTKPNAPMYTLTSGDRHAVCCADVAPTIPSSGAPYERTGNERVECDALVAYGALGRCKYREGECAETLRACGHKQTDVDLVVHGTQDPCVQKEVSFAQGRNNGGENVILTRTWEHPYPEDDDPCRSMQVRRLTPTECARLQGFPDNHTNISYGRPKFEDQNCPDGHQYKAYGNSMAVPCMCWIGERIVKAVCP